MWLFIRSLPNFYPTMTRGFLSAYPAIPPHYKWRPVRTNINVWFPFMYSQKWNFAAFLFLKENFYVLSPNSNTHMSLRDLYISRIGLSNLLQLNTICGLILGIYESLTDTWICKLGTEAAQFPEKEYIKMGFSLQCIHNSGRPCESHSSFFCTTGCPKFSL